MCIVQHQSRNSAPIRTPRILPHHSRQRHRAHQGNRRPQSIGARRGDIVLQFLTEAMTLTGVGGIIGIIVAVFATFLVGYLVPSLPSEVQAWSVIVGFVVSVSVGLFFGVWPAFKAAKLDPVEALRYE